MFLWTILTLALTVCADLCFAKGVFSVERYRHVPVHRSSATVRRVGNVYVFPYYSATRRRIHRCAYGGYKLGCCAGWKRNTEVGTCTPICESGCVQGMCVAPNQCRCRPGYTGSNCNADLNECGMEPRPCNQRCINTFGSYRCHCEEGYLLEEDGKTCIRDSRCYPGRCAYGCRKNGYRLECICPAGLELARDGYHCLDIDECATGIVQCPSDQRCVNTYGNYMCLCQEGFQFRYINGKLQCTGTVDPCANQGFICDTNAKCLENGSGVVKCHCNEGFVGNGQECRRVELKTCASRPCFRGVSCSTRQLESNDIPYPEGGVLKLYQCSACPAGYRGDGEACADIDECVEGTSLCDLQATCTNTIGSYRCVCKDGFTGSGVVCVAIGCDFPGPLVNGVIIPPPSGEDGQYSDGAIIQFDCRVGYALQGASISTCLRGMWTAQMPQCTDIDECQVGDAVCHEHASCLNVPGSYRCTCNPEYTGNGLICFPLYCTVSSQFLNGIRIPQPLGDEYNNGDLVTFQCNDGFLLMGSSISVCHEGTWSDPFPTCVDADECATTGQNSCHENADCVNIPGSHRCQCRDGFFGDGQICIRIDQVQCADSPCAEEVTCTDLNEAVVLAGINLQNYAEETIKLYTCGACPAGYRGNGTTCVDIDECAENLFECGLNAQCANVPGSYNCQCRDGFYGDGHICILIDSKVCANLPCFSGTTCVDLDRATTLSAISLDNPPETITFYQCLDCPEGWEGDGIDCTNTDECQLGTHDCDENAECFDVDGSFECVCGNGYFGNGRVCIRIDQTMCADNPCFPGVNCEDLTRDEMVRDVTLIHPVPVLFQYRCGPCPDGYHGDGIQCVDTDECQLGTHNCDENAECFNFDGSFECVCRNGYFGNGTVCIRIDQTMCADNPCFPGVNCDDLNRGEVVRNVNLTQPPPVLFQYRCGPCPDGYRGDGIRCIDVDECAEDTGECHPDARCNNIQGSFECLCNDGFHGDGKACIPMDLTVCTADGPCFEGVNCTNLTRSDVLAKIDLGSATPEDIIKFYLCGPCPIGYSGDGELCDDIDECALGQFDCHQNADCSNEEGGYSCVCTDGHLGNGSHCAQLDDRSCSESPCFAGVQCTDADIINVDFTQPLVRLFECGDCPEDYSGDGIECIKDYISPFVNLSVIAIDHTDPIDDMPAPGTKINVFVADTSSDSGTVRVASALTGPDGVATLSVPHNQTLIVTASRFGNLDNSLTTKAHRKMHNVVTIPLAIYEGLNIFLWRKATPNAFEFGGQEGGSQYRVAFPADSMRVPERRRVQIEFFGVNITLPEQFEHAPEPIAAIRQGSGRRGDIGGTVGESGVKLVPLEVIGMMELGVIRTDSREKPHIKIPVQLQIPISRLAGDLKIGDSLDAWYFDPDSGVWLNDGRGIIEEDLLTNMLIWTYQARHFTWWAAGRPQAQPSCVHVKTCLDSACTQPVPGVRIRLTGDDYGYLTSRITDRDGETSFNFKHTGAVTLEAVCAMERSTVISTTLPAVGDNSESDIPARSLDPNVPADSCREVTLVLPPLAANMDCPDPGDVPLADRLLSGLAYSNSVQYTCPIGRTPDTADGYRTCLECGLWSGPQINCVESNQFKKRKRRSFAPRARRRL